MLLGNILVEGLQVVGNITGAVGRGDHQQDGFRIIQHLCQLGRVVWIRVWWLACSSKLATGSAIYSAAPSMEPTTRLSLAMEWILISDKETESRILPPKGVDKYE